MYISDESGVVWPHQQRTKGLRHFNHFELICWLSLLLIMAGDVHQNPGPTSPISSDSSTASNCSSSIDSCLKIVHYNVQSFFGKKDILYADLLSFTETWLSSTITDSDIVFPSFHTGAISYLDERIFLLTQTSRYSNTYTHSSATANVCNT